MYYTKAKRMATNIFIFPFFFQKKKEKKKKPKLLRGNNRDILGSVGKKKRKKEKSIYIRSHAKAGDGSDLGPLIRCG